MPDATAESPLERAIASILGPDEGGEAVREIAQALLRGGVEEATEEPDPLVSDIATDRLSSEERILFTMTGIMRRFQRRRTLLAESLTASEVADILDVSRQTAHDRRDAGKLFGVYVNNTWRYPAWQFDPESPTGIMEGLPRVLSCLDDVPELTQLFWFSTPRPEWHDKTAVELLRAGRVDEVCSYATAVAAGG